MAKQPVDPIEKELTDDLSSSLVMERYTKAGVVAQDAMRYCISLLTEGALVHELCTKVDEFIKKEAGVAIPTNISLNNMLGHFCPGPDDKTCLAATDLVKIDIGPHVDGYIVRLTQTVAMESVKEPVEEGKRRFDLASESPVIGATKKLVDMLKENVKMGVDTRSLKPLVLAIQEEFKVHVSDSVVCRDVKRRMLEGPKWFGLSELTKDHCVIQEGDVFALDVLVTTGPGKATDKGTRTMIYRRDLEQFYVLKTKSAAALFKEISKDYPWQAFSMSWFKDATKAKAGMSEIYKQHLVEGYPVRYEKDGETVAETQITVACTKEGVVVLADVV